VGGTATLHADSGDVDATRVAGKLSATLDSGRIRVEGMPSAGSSAPSVSLESGSGDIEVTLHAPADVTARADSGKVTVTAPDNCCRVQAHAGSGDEQIRLRENPSSAVLLDLRTGSGDIEVRSA
jgi:DUF4097 and DUF4098 domain-containing protein YvlB